uniref:Histidine-phosphotransfer domain HPT-domain-containing protein n=1 Tax=Mycena chlorophos TaxID=658473 RepID=A0ABQ0LH56_MYCCL|nr:histidine-phosphotransfer domain HPT-domain-containing protein [Mycena chlorophos]
MEVASKPSVAADMPDQWAASPSLDNHIDTHHNLRSHAPSRLCTCPRNDMKAVFYGRRATFDVLRAHHVVPCLLPPLRQHRCCFRVSGRETPRTVAIKESDVARDASVLFCYYPLSWSGAKTATDSGLRVAAAKNPPEHTMPRFLRTTKMPSHSQHADVAAMGFDCLPLDIIQEVFAACIPAEGHKITDYSVAPVSLCRVCSSWRRIVRATPTLWARITIVEPTIPLHQTIRTSNLFAMDQSRLRLVLEAAKAWLSLSQAVPLSVSLQCTASLRPGTPARMWPSFALMELVLACATRWRNVRLHVPELFLDALRDLPPLPFLSNFSISIVTDYTAVPTTAFDWSPFRLLRSPNLHSETILDVLPRCKRLRKCVLAVDQIPALPQLHVECDLLEVLELRCFGTSIANFGMLWENVALPKLRELLVTGWVSMVDCGFVPAEALRLFFAVSNQLERLELATETFGKPTLLALLRAIPLSVTWVRLVDIDASVALEDDVLGVLTEAGWLDVPSLKYDDTVPPGTTPDRRMTPRGGALNAYKDQSQHSSPCSHPLQGPRPGFDPTSPDHSLRVKYLEGPSILSARLQPGGEPDGRARGLSRARTTGNPAWRPGSNASSEPQFPVGIRAQVYKSSYCARRRDPGMGYVFSFEMGEGAAAAKAKTKSPSPPPPDSGKDAKDSGKGKPEANDDNGATSTTDGTKDGSGSSEVVNMETFSQILELDEDETHDFSKEMVVAYFSQASSTFTNMDKALAEKDLPELSSLGHFLKGSSAALGIHLVQAACEKMQHFGDLRDADGSTPIEASDALARIEILLPETKEEYAEAERWLKKFYADKKAPFDDDAPS